MTHLEGRNGIGKSLAVRLLQLAAGQSPYRGLPLAWESLRSQLQSATIVIDRLSGGETIEVTLTPAEWPEEPVAIRDARLGMVSIDGISATIQDLHKLLAVHRVAGDETLAETLGQAIEERRWLLSRVEQQIDDRVNEWDTRFEDALSLIRGLDVAALDQAQSELTEAGEVAQEKDSARTSAADRVEGIRELAEAAELLNRTRDRLPTVQRELRHARHVLTRLERTFAERSQELRSLLDLKSQSKKTREELQRWASLLRRRQTALQKAELDLSHELHVGGLKSPEPSAVKRAVKAANAELDEVSRRRAEIDQLGPALDLQRGLATPLNAAIREGRGSAVVAYLQGPIRADELRVGVERRSHELANQPKPGEIEDLDSALERLRIRLSALGRVAAAARKRDRARELYEEAASQLASLAGRSGPTAEARLQQAQAAVAVAQERLVAQRVEIAKLERELAELESITGGDLAERVATLEADVGVAAEEVPSELERATRALDETGAEYSDAVAVRRAAETRLQSLLGRLALTTSDLQAGGALSWLRPAWAVLAAADANLLIRPGGRLTGEARRVAAVLGRLEHLLQPLADMASELRNALTAATELLGLFATQVRERGLGQTPTEGVRVRTVDDAVAPRLLRREIESDFSELFGTPQLREELFGGAGEVRLDVDKLTIHWIGQDGGTHQRPLEAFSSGEQAFAYTLAKLESLAERRTTKYVLLVLDEFGAFVARDRLTQLLSYVQRRALGRIADQVVVVLPLAQDYARSADPAHDDETVWAQRVRQVRDREYFALPAEYVLA